MQENKAKRKAGDWGGHMCPIEDFVVFCVKLVPVYI